MPTLWETILLILLVTIIIAGAVMLTIILRRVKYAEHSRHSHERDPNDDNAEFNRTTSFAEHSRRNRDYLRANDYYRGDERNRFREHDQDQEHHHDRDCDCSHHHNGDDIVLNNCLPNTRITLNHSAKYILETFTFEEESQGNPCVLLSDIVIPCGNKMTRFDFILVGRFGCCCFDTQNININILSDTCGCVNANSSNPGFSGKCSLQSLINRNFERTCICEKVLARNGQSNVPCTPCIINTNEDVPVNLTPCQPVCDTDDLRNFLSLGFFHSDNGTCVEKCARILNDCSL